LIILEIYDFILSQLMTGFLRLLRPKLSAAIYLRNSCAGELAA
jgi:hypothetical protein